MDVLIEEMAGGLWVASLDQGRLQGLEVDPPMEEVRWGSVYWAKVARIDKALDAAYVNLDGDNIGILHNADVRIKQKDGTYKKGGDQEIGKLISPGDMIAVQAKGGFLSKDPEQPFAKADSKSPRVSMNVVIPGRYLIYTPMEKENRVSQRIRDKEMRKQLMSMLDNLKDCESCILRAASANTQTDILIREAKLLAATWDQLQGFFTGDAPQIIMAGPDAMQRTLSDQADREINIIELTTMDHYHHTEEWCDLYAPDLMTRITPVEIEGGADYLGLFEYRDIIGQIEELFQPYVILGAGATIIIQEVAALTAIDINSAADTRSSLAINQDSAVEIARQLRLRNLGGIIMIDFLRMKTKKDKEKLLEAVHQAFDDDPCTVQVHGYTNLGLLEVTRHRRTPPLLDRFESAMGDAE